MRFSRLYPSSPHAVVYPTGVGSSSLSEEAEPLAGAGVRGRDSAFHSRLAGAAGARPGRSSPVRNAPEMAPHRGPDRTLSRLDFRVPRLLSGSCVWPPAGPENDRFLHAVDRLFRGPHPASRKMAGVCLDGG